MPSISDEAASFSVMLRPSHSSKCTLACIGGAGYSNISKAEPANEYTSYVAIFQNIYTISERAQTIPSKKVA